MPNEISLISFPNTDLDIEISGKSQKGRFTRTGPSTPPDDPNDPNTPINDDIALTLEPNRTSAVAPAAFQIRALATGFSTNRPYQDLRYRWTFSDPGNWRRVPTDMPWGSDRNIAFGPWTAHTYGLKAADFNGDASVTRVITCDVTDGTNTASASVTVTIKNPDFVYAGTKTICISQNGNFSGAPAGCQTFTSVAAARAEFYQKSVERRILLRRGETFDLSDGNGFDCQNPMVGHFGPETDPYPIVSPAGIKFTFRVEGNPTIWGIDAKGSYDPSKANAITSSTGFEVDGKLTGTFTTIHDCSAAGFGYCIAPESNRRNVMVSDFYGTDWYDFGYYQGNAGWVSIIGTAFVQNPLSKNYNGKYDTPYANHGPMRMSRLQDGPIILRNVDAAAFTDWSMSPGSKYSVQPPCRLNNGGADGFPEICVTQLRATGGVLGLPITNPYSDSRPVVAVFDKVYAHRWGQSGTMSGSSFGGVTFKNMVLVEGNVPSGGSSVFSAGNGYAGGAVMAANWEEYLSVNYPVEWVGCTVVKLQDASHLGSEPINWNPISLTENTRLPGIPAWGSKTRDPASVSLHNIAYHVPAWGRNLPIDVSSLFNPYPVGRREGESPLDTTYGYQPSDAPKCTPTQVIPVEPDEKLPIDDFYGKLRGNTPSRGAIEPVS